MRVDTGHAAAQPLCYQHNDAKPLLRAWESSWSKGSDNVNRADRPGGLLSVSRPPLRCLSGREACYDGAHARLSLDTAAIRDTHHAAHRSLRNYSTRHPSSFVRVACCIKGDCTFHGCASSASHRLCLSMKVPISGHDRLWRVCPGSYATAHVLISNISHRHNHCATHHAGSLEHHAAAPWGHLTHVSAVCIHR